MKLLTTNDTNFNIPASPPIVEALYVVMNCMTLLKMFLHDYYNTIPDLTE